MGQLRESKIPTAELVFYSKEKPSWMNIPQVKEDSTLLSVGIFLHASFKDVQKTIPSIAFRLLPEDGRVIVSSEAHTPAEHSEAVEWAGTNRIPFSEHLVKIVREVSGFLRRRKVNVELLMLTTVHERAETLEKVFELYDSWYLGYGDLFMLGAIGPVDLSQDYFKNLSMSRGPIPPELLEPWIYLMITAETHGAYLFSQKITRQEIQKVCSEVLSDYGWQLAIKEV